MNKQAFWSVENVSTFKGHDVVNGEVDVSDDVYGDYLDELYPNVEVAGMTFCASRIIQELDPVAWSVGMGEYESRLQSELEEQLSNEDSDDIEFIEGDEDDEDYDYGYKAFEDGEPCNEKESDDWVAGWIDAQNNKKYSDENPV